MKLITTFNCSRNSQRRKKIPTGKAQALQPQRISRNPEIRVSGSEDVEEHSGFTRNFVDKDKRTR
ncbi:uncharacterized protein LOC116424992 [Nomia melanderi]|uniref:uncharacterized protein LOC116424992 n=1 Tax=Nomia melanderi TaxID=2448451 RepID=UPI003FCD98EB